MMHRASPSEWWEFPPDVYLDHRHRSSLMLAVRGGRLILAVEPPPAAPGAGAQPLVTRRPSLPRERRA